MDWLLLYCSYSPLCTFAIYHVIYHVHQMYQLIQNVDNYYQVNFPADDLGKTCFH